MTRKTQRMLKKLFPYFSVLLIGILIVLGVLLFAKNEEKGESPEIKTTTAPEEENETEETTTEETSPTVAAVDVLGVDQIIDRYYVAKINDDAEELNEIVDGETEYNVADLADESQFIERYDNFKTYTIPGLTEDCFLVYVKYDIFFKGISTGAPALNHFVVTKDSDGNYTISDKDPDGDFLDYIHETENSKIVLDLKAQVEKELQAACDENEDLKYLMAMLNNESVDPESSEEESTEADSGEEQPDESDTSAETEEGSDTETEDGEGEKTSETESKNE